MKIQSNPYHFLLAAAFSITSVHAATYYWDGNGATAGAASSPAGTWGTSAFWSTNVLGTSATTNATVTAVDDVVFSAGTDATGTYVVTTTAARDVRNMTFEEGNVTLAGDGGSITYAAAGGLIAVNGGASATIGGTTTAFLAGSTPLTKQRGGTLNFNGAASQPFTGGINLNGGVIALDFLNLASGTDLIAATNGLTFNGASMTIKGRSSGATSQSFSGVTVNAGGAQLLANPNGGTSTTIALQDLTLNAGSNLLVGSSLTPGAGSVSFTTRTAQDATGTYGSRVVLASGVAATGYDWARSSSLAAPYALTPFTSYIPAATSGINTNHSVLTAGSALTADLTTTSLKVEAPAAAQSLALGGNMLTLGNGGLLATGTNSFSIAGTTGSTRLTAGNGSGSYDLVVHQFNTGGFTISAPIGDNGANPVSLTKAGLGTLTLSGANLYTGVTNVNSGALLLTSALALPSTTSVNVANGAKLQIAIGSATSSFPAFPITLNGNGSNSDLEFPSGNSATYNIASPVTINNGAVIRFFGLINNYNLNGAITGNGSAQNVVFRTEGNNTAGQPLTVRLGAASTYTGNTSFSAISQQGILRLAIANALPATTALTLSGAANANTSAALDLAGFDQTLVALSGAASTGGTSVINTVNATTSLLTLSGTTDSTFAGTIGSLTANRSNIALTKGGTSNITLSGTNYHTGATTVNGGKLIFSNLLSIPPGTVAANAGGAVSFALSAGAGTETAPVAYAVTKDLAFNGTATQATLDATVNNRINFSGVMTLSGETRFTRFSNWGYLVFDGKITGTPGGLTDNLTLYAGGGGANNSQRFVFNNPANDYDGNTTLLANFGANAVFQAGASNVLPVTTSLILNSNWGPNANNRGPMKTGETQGPNAPLVELQGTTQTIAALTTIGGANGSGGVSGRRIVWGGLADPTSGTELGGTLNLTSTGNSINVGGSAATALLLKNVTVNQTGVGSLAVIGASTTLELLAASTLQSNGVAGTGSLVINSGTLRAGAAPASSWISSNTSVLLYDTLVPSAVNTIDTNSADVVVDAILSNFDANPAGFNKIGSGALRLTNANTYSGPTTVSAGRLEITGSLGATPVEIKSAATLSCTGTLGGAVTVRTGGRLSYALAATAASQTAQQITGALTLEAGTLVDLQAAATPAAGVYVLATAAGGISGTPGTVNLPAGVTGSLAVNGTSLELTVTVAPPPSGFGTWIAGTFANGTVPEAQRGAASDPDGDGISNLVEYALAGLDPTAANGAAGTLAGKTITYLKRQPLASDLTYTLQQSADLAVATPWQTVTATAEDDSSISYTLPPGPGKNFVRLVVTKP